MIYVAAKDATCTELGNIEYWYCADCGQAWLDELCIYNTNLKAVVLPMADHTYTNAHDTSCNACGTERTLAASDIILKSGNSITEIRGGLGFKFDVAANGIVIGDDYVADYSNATIAIDGVEYKLVGMGAIANNKGYAAQELSDVNGKSVLNIAAEKAFEMNGAVCFAVRIINIPAAHLDTEITVRSYFTYVNAEGAEITVYGEDWTTSYNAVLNG